MNDQINQSAGVKLWTKTFIKLCVINFLFFIGFHMIMSTFSYYILDLGGDEAMAGLAAGMFSVSAVLLRPVVGWILDNKGRKVILFVGAIGLVIFPLAFSACTILILAVILRLGHGIIWACSTTATNTIASDMIPKKRFGEGMSFFSLSSTVSTAIGPSIGLILIEGASFRVMFTISAACALVGLIFVLSTKIAEQPLQQKQPLLNSLKTLFNPVALPASLSMFFFVLSYGAITNFIALYSEKFDLLNGGLYFAIMATASAIVRIFSGKIIDTKGEGIVVYYSNAAMAASLLILAFFPNSFCYLLSAFLYGLAFGTMTPALQSMALRIAEPERRGSASSTYLCSIDLGIGAGSTIAGFLAKYAGYNTMFLVMTFGAVVSVIIYFLWGKNHPSSFSYDKRIKN